MNNKNNMSDLNNKDHIDDMITDGYKSINFSSASKDKIRNRLLFDNKNSDKAISKKKRFCPTFVPIAVIVCVMIAVVSFTLINGKKEDSSNVTSNQETDDNYIQFYKRVSICTKYANIENAKINKAEILYCDEITLIFKDNYGLFIYSFETESIVNSLDLKYINCDKDKGDNACTFTVFENGKIIKLYNGKDTYHFSWMSNYLYKGNVEGDPAKQDQNNINDLNNTKMSLDTYSSNYATINNNKLYLNCSGNSVKDLSYVLEDKNGVLKTEKIFNKARQVDNAEIVCGPSSVYTKEDIDSAIEVIKHVFIRKGAGIELLKIEYDGDSYNSGANVAWLNSVAYENKYKVKYTKCIQFKCDFRTSDNKEDIGCYNTNTEYKGYKYSLARTEDGEWQLVSAAPF